MTPSGKDAVKRVLGQIPFAAELYWLVRQNGRPISTRFSLKHLQTALPEVVQQAAALRAQAPAGRKVFIFATLHYWIEHAAMLAVGLAAQGHEVTHAPHALAALVDAGNTSFDLALLDLDLPGLDGFALARPSKIMRGVLPAP